MNHSTAFPGFRLRLTRWGAIYLLALLVLGFAAVNTGNNALMGLLGLALASYAVSGLWSRETLGRTGLQVTALPRDVFAGRPVVVEVELHNRSRWFPAYGLVLRDATGRRLLAEALLGPGARCRRGIELEFPARGWTVLGPWTLEVLLPLGFFLKSKRLVQERRILVYPRLLPSATATPSAAGGGRSLETFDGRGREGEVVQLRPYRDGDDSRQLHWRQTARQQRPIVVDRQRRAAAPVAEPASLSHRHAGLGQPGLGLAHREGAVMEDAGGQGGLSSSKQNRIGQVVRATGPPARNHGDSHRVADRLGYLQIISVFCAIGIH